MKYNLSKPLIKEMVSKPEIWLLGYEIFKEGEVHIIEGLNKVRLRALVNYGRPFDISMTFSKLGELLHHQCSCHIDQNLCEHCTAVLIQLTEEGELLERVDSKELPWPFSDHTISGDVADDTLALIEPESSTEAFDEAMKVVTDVKAYRMLEPFKNVKIRWDMIPISLKGYLEWLNDDIYPVALSLKIGSSHDYNVKDVPALTDAFINGEKIYYGKHFTFDPQKHCIDEAMLPLFEFVQDLIGEQVLLGTGQPHKQKLHLTTYRFRQLIDLALAYHMTLYEKASSKPIDVIEALPELKFEIGAEDDAVIVNSNMLSDYSFVGNEGFFLRSHARLLYKMPSRLQKIFIHFKPIVDLRGFDPIPWHMVQAYVDTMLPIFNRIGTVAFDERMTNIIVAKPPEHRLYIDYKDKAIVIKAMAVYGDIQVNILSSEVTGNLEDHICIRDWEAEHKIRQYFENDMFIEIEDTYRIIREQHIYQFLVTTLKELAQVAKIYSTKRFKHKRIIEPTQLTQHVQISEKLDYLSFSASLEGISQDELRRILKAYREKKNYYLLRNGAYLSLEKLNLDLLDKTISHFGIKQSALGKPINLPLSAAYYLKDLVEGEAEKPLEAFMENVKTLQDEPINIPEDLRNALRPYQLNGVSWLITHSKLNLGGILADDMGLGKTVQILAYLMDQRSAMEGRRALIVAPTSLIYNWAHEIEKFTKGLSYSIISGTQEERHQKIKKSRATIWITSYGSLRRDIVYYEEMRFFSVILDEAQHIKNEGSLGAKHVKRLQADHRFAVTGTPIENHLGEMWSIFDFILPRHLGTRHYFKNHFEKPILIENDAEAKADLQKIISPFILRRLKQDVLKELPEKIESHVYVGMSVEQRKVYLATLEQLRGAFDNEGSFNRIKMLAGLTRLRQICSHPSSYLEDYDGGSGKMDAFMETLRELKLGGHRTLVFSQFTSVLRILKANVNLKSFYLDGKTGAEERLRMVDRFNEGERDVFFISLKAGGTGLNLTGADTVIHYDPWWNPAVEYQASDRAHRIGQTKKVHVIRFITEDSIEEKIQILQQRKKELIDTFIKPGETLIQQLSEKELYTLFFE